MIAPISNELSASLSPSVQSSSRSAYRLTLVLHTAQHFVLDLNQIPGIEEIVGPEQFVGDLIGVRIP